MKKIIAILCVVSLLAALFVGCNTGKTPADNTESADKNSTQTVLNHVGSKIIDKKLAFVSDDKLIVTQYDAYERRFTLTYSLDGTAAVCHRDHDALLYVHDGTVEELADYAESYSFSTDGNAVAFLADGCLYLHQKETGETVQVDTGTEEVYSYALSPDGKTLAYVTANEKISHLFVYRDGVSTLRAEFDGSESNAYKVRYYLISTNNSADIIYVCSDVRGVIGVDGEGNKTDVGNSDSDSLFYLNADHSQLLFYNSLTYLSDQGCEAVALMQNRAKLLPVQLEFGEFPENRAVITCHYEDLSAALMSTGAGLQHPNENGGYTVLETGAIGYTQHKGCLVVREGQYLLYNSPNLTLYQIDLKNDVQPTELAQGVEKFAVSKDGRTYYYATVGETVDDSYLYRCDVKTGSQEKVTTHRVLDMYCTEDGKLFFQAVEDGHQNLYTLTSGGEVKLLLEDVERFEQDDSGLIYAVAGDDYYVARGAKLIQLEVKTMGE